MNEFNKIELDSISINKNHIDDGRNYGVNVNNLENRGNYSVMLSFRGHNDEISDRKIIQSDTYINVRLFGETILEVLQESINFIRENNIKH